MADKEAEPPTQEENSPPNSPEPKSPRLNGDYIVLSNNESESDSSSLTLSSSDKNKSQGSSLSSFADVGIQESEATLEKGHSEDVVAKLMEDAGKEISYMVSEVVPSESDKESIGGEGSMAGQNIALNPISGDPTVTGNAGKAELNRDRSISDDGVTTGQPTNLTQFSPGSESLHVRASTDPGNVEGVVNGDAVVFDNITYLGSSTVNAPVSEIELKRTMSILAEQTEVTIDVLLSVGSTTDGLIRLIDPENDADIATYRIQRILFCGRGDIDGAEKDCFAFNTVHGDSDIFHCHVFRCKEPDMVSC